MFWILLLYLRLDKLPLIISVLPRQHWHLVSYLDFTKRKNIFFNTFKSASPEISKTRFFFNSDLRETLKYALFWFRIEEIPDMPTFLELGPLFKPSGTDPIAERNRLHTEIAEIHTLGVGELQEPMLEYEGCTKSDFLVLAYSGMLSIDPSDHKLHPGPGNLSWSNLQPHWPLSRKRP